MAEFVQQSIEEMLPELEQMERVGLFTDQEIRQILKKRKSYEYKLRRKTKCKEDFLQYIQFVRECRLHVMISMMKCAKKACSESTRSLEYFVDLRSNVGN